MLDYETLFWIACGGWALTLFIYSVVQDMYFDEIKAHQACRAKMNSMAQYVQAEKESGKRLEDMFRKLLMHLRSRYPLNLSPEVHKFLDDMENSDTPK